MTEEGTKEPESGKASRRDFVRIAGSALLGAVGGFAVKKPEQPEQPIQPEQPVQPQASEVIIDTEVTMPVLPFDVRSSISASGAIQNPVDKEFEAKIRTDDQIRDFLKGGSIISSIMTEKYLIGALSADDLYAVSDAIRQLTGSEITPHEQAPGKDLNTTNALNELNTSIKAT